MELNGEEKTIRVLFSEMKLEDERATPTFALEEKRRHRPGGALSFGRVVFAVALAGLILVSTLLLRHYYFETQPLRKVAEQSKMDVKPDQEQVSRPDVASRLNKENPKPTIKAPRQRRMDEASKTRLASSLRRRKAEISLVFDWQSPTGAFLRSPGDELLKSLPQLNQSTRKLGSFLNSTLN